MTTIYFTDGTNVTTKATTVGGVTRVINNNCQSTSCKDITDEIDYYNWDEDEKKFIEQHRDKCSFFHTYESVCGMWDQPIDIVAVEKDEKICW